MPYLKSKPVESAMITAETLCCGDISSGKYSRYCFIARGTQLAFVLQASGNSHVRSSKRMLPSHK